jgi:alpha-tubulin suppressor-like RCC1 family protein
MQDVFEFVPNETILNIGLSIPLKNIVSLCLTSRKFNEVICNNEYFWRQRFIQDYKFVPINYTGSWRHLYQNYRNVWVCGNNRAGQLGLGDTVNRNVPTQIPNMKALQVSGGNSHTVIIDLENNVWVFGNNEYGQLGLGDNTNRTTPTQILNLKAKQVSAGENHTAIIDLENNVWVFGFNNAGQLGLGDNTNINIPTQIQSIKSKQIAMG